MTMVWPTLRELQPDRAAPRQVVRVIGSGGYLQGSGGYNESLRAFGLTLAGQPAGRLSCYVNRCEGSFEVPAGLTPGTYAVATEGGSALTLTVVAPYALTVTNGQ
jgi:hypothetical protein